MLTFNSIALLLSFIYLFLINLFRTGWKRIAHFSTSESAPDTKIAVIIPIKNELDKLPALLDALNRQKGVEFQLIVIDDNSDDAGFDYIAKRKHQFSDMLLLPNEGTGKKQAIKTAINHTECELIVSLDADCIPGENWLKTIAHFYDASKPDLIICPVNMTIGSSFVQRFQQFEFISLIGSGAGAAGAGMPILCNGANLAFTREAWRASEAELHFDTPSGDDIFLLQSIKKRGGSIEFLKSENAMVDTKPQTSWKAFMTQRSRWAGKMSIYKDFQLTATALIVASMSALIPISLALSIADNRFVFILLIVFAVKWLADTLFFNDIKSFFSLKSIVVPSLVFSLIYPFYIVLTLIIIPFRSKNSW